MHKDVCVARLRRGACEGVVLVLLGLDRAHERGDRPRPGVCGGVRTLLGLSVTGRVLDPSRTGIPELRAAGAGGRRTVSDSVPPMNLNGFGRSPPRLSGSSGSRDA